MKKVLLFLCIFIPKIQAQNVDASLFGIHKIYQKTTNVLSWTTYTKEKFSLQLRTNFDAPNTVAIVPGRIFTFGKILFVPECGVLFGDYKSISPEFYAVIPVSNKWSMFLFGQYSVGILKSNSFMYSYVQGLYQIKNIKVGVGAQYFKSTSDNSTYFLDVGPQIKYTFTKTMYLKPWYTFDPLNNWRQKAMLGFGFFF